MREKQKPSDELGQLAVRQGGALSLEQCSAFGLGRGAMRRLVREGWVGLGYGCVATHEPTFTTWCWAGLLRGGPDAAIGALAAAHLWGVWPEEPETITVYAPRWITTMLGPVEFVQAARPGEGLLTLTSPAVTLVDAAAVLDEGQLISLVTAANRKWPAVAPRVREQIESSSRVAHRQLLGELVAPANTGIESTLEFRFLRDVLRAHGLPVGTAQKVERSRERRDRVFEEYGVLIELDGQLGHADQAFRDMRRDNRAALQGYRGTLRFGWNDTVAEPCSAAWQVAQMLHAWGWHGIPTSCPRCRRVPHRDRQ